MHLSGSKHEPTCEYAMHVGSIVEYSFVLIVDVQSQYLELDYCGVL